jgi:hypothetical protein
LFFVSQALFFSSSLLKPFKAFFKPASPPFKRAQCNKRLIVRGQNKEQKTPPPPASGKKKTRMAPVVLPARAAAALLLFVAAILLSAAPQAARAEGHDGGLPGLLDCSEAADKLGENNLLIRLSACASGTTPACCTTARGLLQLGEGGELAGCVCRPLALELTLSRIEANTLAKSFGVTRDTVTSILKNCGIKYAGGEGENQCPCSDHKHCGDKHGGRRLFASAAV